MLTFNQFLAGKGFPHWVLAKRTAGIVRRYGEDVTCFSQKQYAALEAEYEESILPDHPAVEPLTKWLGNHCDAVNTLKVLHEAGFRVEQVRK